jgi:hypothetical protein
MDNENIKINLLLQFNAVQINFIHNGYFRNIVAILVPVNSIIVYTLKIFCMTYRVRASNK